MQISGDLSFGTDFSALDWMVTWFNALSADAGGQLSGTTQNSFTIGEFETDILFPAIPGAEPGGSTVRLVGTGIGFSGGSEISAVGMISSFAVSAMVGGVEVVTTLLFDAPVSLQSILELTTLTNNPSNSIEDYPDLEDLLLPASVGVSHTGTELADRISGFSSRDELIARGGDDVVFGFGGADSLSGGAGADDLYGGNGRDTLSGGTGSDDLFGQDGADSLIGLAGSDELDGGRGADELAGGAGQDTLLGGSGHDLLNGGNGDDVLRGGTGRDTLDGGAGNDKLFGGRGADVFLFTDESDRDKIKDFDPTVDTIQFDGLQSVDDLTVRVRGDNLILRYGDSRVTLEDMATADPNDWIVI